MSKDYASILILISKNINLEKILVHATCTSPIMHLICAPHPKFCITFVFYFSWALQPSQEKLKVMLMQNIGRVGGGGN